MSARDVWVHPLPFVLPRRGQQPSEGGSETHNTLCFCHLFYYQILISACQRHRMGAEVGLFFLLSLTAGDCLIKQGYEVRFSNTWCPIKPWTWFEVKNKIKKKTPPGFAFSVPRNIFQNIGSFAHFQSATKTHFEVEEKWPSQQIFF